MSQRPRRSRELVVLDPARCPTCGGGIGRERWQQPALVRHGGHGETAEHVVRRCAAGCGWSLLEQVASIRPI